MKTLRIIIICMFFAVIAIPLVTFNWEENVVSEIDNSELTNNPFGDNYEGTGGITDALEDYVQDRIGFRDEMILAYTVLHDKMFGEMVHPLYMYGKDDYVFMKTEQNTRYNEYHESFVEMLGKIQDYCEEREVPFLFMINPSKTSVLREELADGINYNNDWLAQFEQRLEEEGINYIDTTEVLKEKEQEGEEVFNRQYNAGHWNDLGAFYGVNALLEQMKADFPDVHINSKDEFTVEQRLNESLQVSQFPIHEYEPFFVPNTEVLYLQDNYKAELEMNEQYHSFGYMINEEREDSPKTLVFQGSYMFGMGYKFMANSLGEYIAVHDYFNVFDFEYYYNIFQPEYVIFEVAEDTVNGSYFPQEGMEEMKLNPVLASFGDLEEEVHDIDECTIERQTGETLTRLTVTGLEGSGNCAYLILNGTELDLIWDEEEEKYTVTVENDMLAGEDMQLITIDEDAGIKLIYRLK